jgi:CHAT domain/NB-ARC domain
MEFLTLEIFVSDNLDNGEFLIKARSRAGGANAQKSRLPFFVDAKRWRTTLIKALGAIEYCNRDFPTEEEQNWMTTTGLLDEERQQFQPKMLTIIGQAIYEALFPQGEVRQLITNTLALIGTRKTLHIQLVFNKDIPLESRLTDYPWELACDDSGFLAKSNVTFSRHIDFLKPLPDLPPLEHIHVLLVSSTAQDDEMALASLGDQEHQAVLSGLQNAQEGSRIQVTDLKQKQSNATFKALGDFLTENRGNLAPHVIHFNGHGFFGKRCDRCRTMHPDLSTTICRACKKWLPGAQGYLLFESDADDERQADYVSAEEIQRLLQSVSLDQPEEHGVRLVVVSACKSGLALMGKTVFNGVAQGLIQAGIPAVVAMRHNVSVKGAQEFSERFYRTLGSKQTIATALKAGQVAMTEPHQWYRPLLYLRWWDNEGGQLFAPITTAKSFSTKSYLNMAPLPPQHFVDRPRQQQEIKALLLEQSPTKPKTLVISAVYGLGGVGKSVMAGAIAQDPRVQERFPDGILWTTLGQNPDILSQLSIWIERLLQGKEQYQMTSQAAASDYLRLLLTDKQALLVVDDVWKAADLNPFKVGSSDCRILVTTREALVPDAQRYDLNEMEPEEALAVLLRYHPQISQKNRKLAADLAKEVGYLPLALELAAAQIEDDLSWQDLLDDLRSEVARLEALDRPGYETQENEENLRKHSLRASFNLSLKGLTPEQLSQFAWLGVLPDDVAIAQNMAAILWEITPKQAGNALRLFKAKTLLSSGPQQPDGRGTYRMHDLMHETAKRLLIASKMPSHPDDLLGFEYPTLEAAQSAFLSNSKFKKARRSWRSAGVESRRA